MVWTLQEAAPIWDELQKNSRTFEDVVIAKMDSVNEVTNVKVKELPTNQAVQEGEITRLLTTMAGHRLYHRVHRPEMVE